MRSSVKRILIAVLSLVVLAFVVTAVIFFIPRDDTSFSFECFRAKAAVSGFLKDLENERYDDAFDAVYCFSAENSSPVESTDACRNAWTGRVVALRTGTDATYLSDFSDLKVRKVNGEMQISVLLSVQRQGYNDPFYSNGSVITVVYDGEWKIASVSAESVELQTPFEQAVSGRLTESERAQGAA